MKALHEDALVGDCPSLDLFLSHFLSSVDSGFDIAYTVALAVANATLVTGPS